ncbi:MAG: hypothetical protein IBX39_07840, partial [Candidatus Methanoperedenaceae archaeon]|nr:hypothetical protein [Candidatus Methanoperedenaceae archaeon]
AKTGKKPVIKKSDVEKTGAEEAKTGKKPAIEKAYAKPVEVTDKNKAKPKKKTASKKSTKKETNVNFGTGAE